MHCSGVFPRKLVLPQMQRNLARLDDVLIERLFQPLADTVQNRFGVDRLHAACFCLDGAALAWIASQAGTLGHAVSHWHGTLAIGRGLLLLLGLVAITSLRTLFQRLPRRPGANPLRASMLPHRSMALILLAAQCVDLTSLGGWTELAMLALIAVALYFSACLPRPPAHRRATNLVGAEA